MYRVAIVIRICVRCRDTDQYTLVTLIPIFTAIQTIAVYSVTSMVDAVYTTRVLTIVSIGEDTF